MILRNAPLTGAVLAVLILSPGLSTAVPPAAIPATFYVAPGGSDDNPGTEAKPFATVEKAQQAVRKINTKMTDDIVVMFRGGVYPIDRTVVFEPEDSGTGGHNVIYRAAPNETPIISGGKPVVGWKADQQGRWRAPTPVEDFRQLYVNGVRATRARGEKPADLELVGDDGYTTTAVDMANWKNPDDIEFCYLVSVAERILRRFDAIELDKK